MRPQSARHPICSRRPLVRVVRFDLAGAGRKAATPIGFLEPQTVVCPLYGTRRCLLSCLAAADVHARSLQPVLRAIRAEGAISIGAVARALNERKIPTMRGSRWHVSSAANLLARAQKLEAFR